MRLALRALLIRLGISANNNAIVATPTVEPPLLVNGQSFFGPTLVRVGLLTVVPALLANSSTFYDPTVTVGPTAVSAPLLVNTQAFFGASVSHPTAGVSVPLLTNASTLYAPSLTAIVKPPSLTNSQVFYGPNLVRGNVPTIDVAFLDGTQSFYGVAVAPGPVAVSPPRFTNPQTFYPVTVHGPVIAPLLVNAQRFYGPTILLPAISVATPLLSNAQTFYGLRLDLTVKPSKLTNSQTFYGPTVTRGGVQTVLPAILTGVQAFFGFAITGRATVTAGIVRNTQTFFGPSISTAATDDIAQARGALTKAGAGSVNIGQLAAVQFTATSSSYTIVSGVDGHWSLPTNGMSPSPTSLGDSLDLSGGPYVFSYSAADGIQYRAGTLTIETRADTYTASLRSELPSILTAGIEGKTVELATGATDFGQSTYASPLSLSKWRATTGCTIKHENSANPCLVGNIQIRLPKNLTLDGIVVTPQARIGTVDKAWYIRTTSPSTGTDQQTQNSITFNACGTTGPSDPTKAVYGFYAIADAAPLAITVTNTFMQSGVQKGYSFYNTANYGLTLTADELRLRYWSADGFIPSEGTTGNMSFNIGHFFFMAPVYDASNSTIHPDSLQVPTDQNLNNCNIDKFTYIQADGDSISQQVFSKNISLVDLHIKNYLAVGRSAHAFTISGTDATHNTFVRNMTAVTQWSGVYSSEDPTAHVLNPGIRLGGYVTQANLSILRAWVQGAYSTDTGYALDPSVVVGGSSTGLADISATFPNAGWISSDTLRTTALANSTGAYTGLDDARWHADMDTVLASVIAALTPASGQVGALKSDGTRPLT